MVFPVPQSTNASGKINKELLKKTLWGTSLWKKRLAYGKSVWPMEKAFGLWKKRLAYGKSVWPMEKAFGLWKKRLASDPA